MTGLTESTLRLVVTLEAIRRGLCYQACGLGAWVQLRLEVA